MASSSAILQKLLVLSAFASRGDAEISCTKDTFANVVLHNSEVISIDIAISNDTTPPDNILHQPINYWPVYTLPATLTCQVTIQYTHVGWNDTVNTYVWLPMSDWNGRLVSVGGGGWATGHTDDLDFHVSRGYAAVTTDGGHIDSTTSSFPSWVVTGEDNVNWYAFQDFAAVTLDDAATLAKQVAAALYGSPVKKSYWNGCSTGGRQGHMMAQRYPTQYDGILATAPAINWDKLIPADYWPALQMNLQDYYPPLCELNAITEAAIAVCDPLDGVTDGIVNGACDFDPETAVGLTVDCGDPVGTITVSEKAARIASAIWSGPSDEDGKFQWYGLHRDSNFSSIANTVCSSATNCSASPFSITTDWFGIFLVGNTTTDFSTLSHEEYSRLFRLSVNRYSSVIGTGDPDLTDFKKAGGKMITWHGNSDPVIPFNGTVDYYERVSALDADTTDYYRFFPVPGLGHCGGGTGWFPGDALDSLVDWVENGKAPETLYAEVLGENPENITRSVELCAYPKVLTYVGGDGNQPSSFTCV